MWWVGLHERSSTAYGDHTHRVPVWGGLVQEVKRVRPHTYFALIRSQHTFHIPDPHRFILRHHLFCASPIVSSQNFSRIPHPPVQSPPPHHPCSFGESEDAIQSACAAIGTIAQNHFKVAKAFTHLVDGSLAVVLSAVRHNRSSPRIVQHASYAIYTIVSAFPRARRVVNAAGGDTLLKQMSGVHRSVRVQRSVDWAIESLKDPDDDPDGVDMYFE